MRIVCQTILMKYHALFVNFGKKKKKKKKQQILKKILVCCNYVAIYGLGPALP